MSSELEANLKNRRDLVQALLRELVGPDPRGEPISTSPEFELPDPVAEREADSGEPDFIPRIYRPWRQASDGEEILTMDRPLKRYGVGILFPRELIANDPGEHGEDGEDAEGATADSDTSQNPIVTQEALVDLQRLQERSRHSADGSNGSDAADSYGGLAGTNSYLPSAMGISFVLDTTRTGTAKINFKAGRYLPCRVTAGSRTYRWWLRRPVHGSAVFNLDSLAGLEEDRIIEVEGEFAGNEPIERFNSPRIPIRFHVLARKHQFGDQPGLSLVTVTVINSSEKDPGEPGDEHALFQCDLQVGTFDDQDNAVEGIRPYPRTQSEVLDEEEEELELLYRDHETFATGHGCAARWSGDSNLGAVPMVGSSCLPWHELHSVSPEIELESETKGSGGHETRKLEVTMADLAGLDGAPLKLGALQEVVEAYESWIERKRAELGSVPLQLKNAGERNIRACEVAAARMRSGLGLLTSPDRKHLILKEAFKLANHAMCLQRIRSGGDRQTRQFIWEEGGQRWSLLEPHPKLPTASDLGGPKWRPFQIAFILMALSSVANPNDNDRETVDLVWFPTGGGKTEAYLGLAAFSIFLRRLRAKSGGTDTEDEGVQVLMRYTLRLLTAQQFQRAAALICAMEYLRRTKAGGLDLGSEPFTLGMWTGATPNDRGAARSAYKKLKEGQSPEDNIVVLEKCPWCRAAMGPTTKPEPKKQRSGARKKRGDSSRIDILGYERCARGSSAAETVIAACSDKECEFSDELPLHFVDEDIYASPPSMIIGTVDKFAMLAWKPRARALFGRDASGGQVCSPPELILQDELHLISGPLGTMVALYETVIEELCSRSVGETKTRPKIISSTATIRRFQEQARRLFGRAESRLFPPPGLLADDSFFARRAVKKDGSPMPGRLHVGVHAPGLGSVQTTQVRTYSALLQAANDIKGGKEEQDPWWTLMTFYNSLRELGGGLTLFYSDVPDYLWAALRKRIGLSIPQLRKLRRVEELTGRLDDRDVVKVISKLEVSAQSSSSTPVDVCLASNIIEVGVDIDRLSLLTVVGQPKSTAQYIQVTGRIGRRWYERPGVVVTIYGPSKPRDRSHFERFRTYHQQLYAQVEPTSVTPFSPPALQRALHATLLVYLRQTLPLRNVEDKSVPNIEDSGVRAAIDAYRGLVEERISRVGHGTLADVQDTLADLKRQWTAWKPRRWSGDVTPDHTDIPLMRWPGRYVSRATREQSWLIPSTMRNVDAECQVEITNYYSRQDAQTSKGVETDE